MEDAGRARPQARLGAEQAPGLVGEARKCKVLSARMEGVRDRAESPISLRTCPRQLPGADALQWARRQHSRPGRGPGPPTALPQPRPAFPRRCAREGFPLPPAAGRATWWPHGEESRRRAHAAAFEAEIAPFLLVPAGF